MKAGRLDEAAIATHDNPAPMKKAPIRLRRPTRSATQPIGSDRIPKAAKVPVASPIMSL